MKLEGKVTYEIETKEDLNELLSQLRFSFLPPMPDNELTQAGALIHDVRPHICILEFIKDRFKNIIYLRPDLNTQFNEVVDELVVLKDKFNSANVKIK